MNSSVDRKIETFLSHEEERVKDSVRAMVMASTLDAVRAIIEAPNTKGFRSQLEDNFHGWVRNMSSGGGTIAEAFNRLVGMGYLEALPTIEDYDPQRHRMGTQLEDIDGKKRITCVVHFEYRKPTSGEREKGIEHEILTVGKMVFWANSGEQLKEAAKAIRKEREKVARRYD